MKIPTDQAYLKRTSVGLKAKYKQHTSSIENVPESQRVSQHFIYFVDIHCGLVFGIMESRKAKVVTTTTIPPLSGLAIVLIVYINTFLILLISF